jgi:hypothetical protein
MANILDKCNCDEGRRLITANTTVTNMDREDILGL